MCDILISVEYLICACVQHTSVHDGHAVQTVSQHGLEYVNNLISWVSTMFFYGSIYGSISHSPPHVLEHKPTVMTLGTAPRHGWCNCIRLTLQLMAGGILVGGPPCGSWVFINRGTSQRSSTRILGNCALKYVRDANSFLVRIYPTPARLFCFLHLPLIDSIHAWSNV